jgi:hypothetical protein
MLWPLVVLLLLGGAAAIAVGIRHGRPLIGVAGRLGVVAAVLLALVGVTRDPESLPVDPNPGASFRIAALGDSCGNA